MDLERILAMDPYMLLSMVNMKLRDFYSSLDSLCDDWDVNPSVIEDKLKTVGYTYNKESNQFVAI
ncbi:hypothetical protein N3C_1318 [Clostridium sp. N3C]|uniref:DUF4250 domain-containing protein n=1 Tax=Clostridium sp. N3C TaxID=1776758 RepID=UPI00092DF873|nr:DUF4250 domain-containing protein [Clostridium sp. N3C]NLM36273.1 DUF4250 domain-containing protein [Clostridiales bacterium]SCN23474.1 hypothetical protein N3C_1318 [Clostridium sp. N3C]